MSLRWTDRQRLSALAIVVTFTVLVSSSFPARANTLIVGGGYATIQSAVNAAAAGDTVSVRKGTYSETVVINKKLTLQAYGDGPVIIDAACSRSNGVQIKSSQVVISGIGVANTTDAGFNVMSSGYTDITFDSVSAENWACNASSPIQHSAGIACWYCSRLTVTNSKLTGGKWGNGIWIKSTTAVPSLGGHYIAGNTISGGYDGIGQETEDDVMGGFVKNSTVENNTVSNCWDDGIQMEGRDENITIQNNDISSCGTGIAFAANLVGPLYVQNNTLHDMRPGYYGNAECFKIGHPGKGITYLTGNTCVTTGSGLTQTDAGYAPVVSRNNCLQVSTYVFDFEYDSPVGLDLDNDTLASSDPTRFIKWGSKSAVYQNLGSLAAATGLELNGSQSKVCPTSAPLSSTPQPTPTLTVTSSPTPIATATSSATQAPSATSQAKSRRAATSTPTAQATKTAAATKTSTPRAATPTKTATPRAATATKTSTPRAATPTKTSTPRAATPTKTATPKAATPTKTPTGQSIKSCPWYKRC